MGRKGGGLMSLKFWNEYASINAFEIENMLLESEFVIEDGKVTKVIMKDKEITE